MAPGTLVYTGTVTGAPVKFTLHQYTANELTVVESENLQEVLGKIDKRKSNWLDVSALHDVEKIRTLCNHFGIHPLVQEDILNTLQQPQVATYDDILFVTAVMLNLEKDKLEALQEHVSFVLVSDYLLITFQEKPGDLFDPVRERMANPNLKIKSRGTAYLLYALIDVLVDNYYIITEHISEQLANLEVELLESTAQKYITIINNYKKFLIYLKRQTIPLKEVLRKIAKAEEGNFSDEVIMFLEDVYTHIEQISHTMESQRETLNGFMDLYMSNVSFKMNNIMKTLTVISTIFIPLTFIAGIYGMNFAHMPELDTRWGYPAVIGLMAVMGVSMFFFMKSKNWF